MSVTTFLLKLVGRHPEQMEEHKRFEENMKGLDERGDDLDVMLEEIKEVNLAVRDKSAALHSTAASIRPGPRELDDTRPDLDELEEGSGEYGRDSLSGQ